MAVPLLAPFVSLLPVFKILALGSLKFVGVGIGAAVAPVMTANFLVGLSAGTPLKYAKFRQEKGHFNAENMALIEQANALISDSIENPEQHLNRADAQEFLKSILLSTLTGMKQSITSIPSRILQTTKMLIKMCKEMISSRGK